MKNEKSKSKRVAGIIALSAAESDTCGFSPIDCAPSRLTAEMNKLSKRGKPGDELRVAYLAGIEFARAAIAASTGNFSIFHEPTADELMNPKF
jgi:hypothetical protein